MWYIYPFYIVLITTSSSVDNFFDSHLLSAFCVHRVHSMIMLDSGTIILKNDFIHFSDLPISKMLEQVSGLPHFLFLVPIRRKFQEWLVYENIEADVTANVYHSFYFFKEWFNTVVKEILYGSCRINNVKLIPIN